MAFTKSSETNCRSGGDGGGDGDGGGGGDGDGGDDDGGGDGDGGGGEGTLLLSDSDCRSAFVISRCCW